MRIFVKLALIVLFLSPVVSRSVAQTNDSVVTRTLNALEKIHSGSMRYVTKIEGGTYNEKRSDTSIFVFSSIDDSSATSFILDRGRVVAFFDSGIYIEADRKLQTFSKRELSAGDAVTQISQYVVNAIASRGTTLKELLDDAGVKRWDTTEIVNGHQRSLLTFHIPERDSDAKNMAVRFVMNERNEVIATRTSYTIWGAPYSEERSILHATYNRPDTSGEMQKAMAILKSVLVKYHEVSDPTVNIIEPASHFNIGSSLPDIIGTTTGGDSIRLSSVDAKLTILDFWFAGCAPCHHMFPALKRLQEKYGDRGLKIIGIDPIDAPEAAQKMVTYEGLNYDNLVVPRSAEKAFDAQVYPTLYLLDSDKKLLWIKRGEGSTEAIEMIIKQKLGE